MRSYATARSLFGFLEFVFWGMVILGVLGALAGADAASGSFGGSGFLGALPGLTVAVFALLGVANIQNARAGVDAAEYAQQTLKVARDQLKVSRQALNPGTSEQASFRAVSSKADHGASDDTAYRLSEPPVTRPKTPDQHQTATAEPKYVDHNNQRIHRVAHMFQCPDGSVFNDLTAAKQHLDKQNGAK